MNMSNPHKERPLSPHLQVYKPQLTSILSIFHRGTGVLLALATPLLVCWLWSIAEGAEVYSQAQVIFSHKLVKLALIGWSFCLFYHLCNGIRHLFWDVGMGYELKNLYASGWVVVISASALTAATWWFACAKLGGV